MSTAIIHVDPSSLSTWEPPSATGDDTLIKLWVHGRSPNTTDAYVRDIARFCAFIDHAPLRSVSLADLQAFADSLAGLAPTSRKRILASVKSLLTFGQQIGYLQFNVGAALKLPKDKNRLGERILDEPSVHAMIAEEPDARNQLLLRLLYNTAARVSEICRLCWQDIQKGKDGWIVTLYGKGDKTRHVLVSAETALALLEHRSGAALDAPVFASPRQPTKPLTRQQLRRIVRAAARRVGVDRPVSPHWLRHAHVSHALDNGAPVHLVQATVGHASLDTTTQYAHVRPSDSSGRYLKV
jgi:integrase/recombinase XerD